jgi:hypothetical protein
MSKHRKNNQHLFIYSPLFLALLAVTNQAQAICPVCTLVIGAGLGLSRWLGIDDTISGLWIGGLTASLIGWTIDWFNRINFRFYGRKILTALVYYSIVIIPLYYLNMIGHPLNRLWGLDKIILGTIIGTIAFVVTVIIYNHMKKNNNDHAYFPFQKVIMPATVLLVLSFIFYFITK